MHQLCVIFYLFLDYRKAGIFMQELKHYDIFTLPSSETETNVVCVTTNGIIKKDGCAVMGAGIAKTANKRFQVDAKLAEHLRTHGNTVCDLGEYKFKQSRFHLVSFPTKEDWKDNSLPWLIEQSAKQLVDLVNAHGYQHVFLTPPGCGLGGLQWESDVKPILEPLFDDRFTIVFR